MLCDELDARGANRSIHPAARPAASRSCVLAAPKEVRSLGAKFSVKKSASSDEPKGPFSEADFFTPSHLNMGLNIQERQVRKRCEHDSGSGRRPCLPVGIALHSAGRDASRYFIQSVRTHMEHRSHADPFWFCV